MKQNSTTLGSVITRAELKNAELKKLTGGG